MSVALCDPTRCAANACVRRVTHEGMCLSACETMGVQECRSGVTKESSAWDRQQDSARDEAVKRFDGAGDGGKTRMAGRGWQNGNSPGT